MPIIPVPIDDFRPDVSNAAPGVIVDCEKIIPVAKGYQSYPALSVLNLGGAVFPNSEALGFAVCILTTGSYRIVAGTRTQLLELAGGWIDKSRSGAAYSAGVNRWQFAVYGTFIYATDKTDAVQKLESANFHDQTTIPKCSYIDRVLDFLIIAGTNEATYNDQADRWWCSALGNPDDFVPSIATQCATNRLTDTPGPITGSKALGDSWIIYKQRSIYRGDYVGPPNVWEFTPISDSIGTWGQGCIVKVGYTHYFLGFEDFYSLDGQLPRPVPNDLKTWFFARFDRQWAFKTQSFYDRYNNLVYWFYVSTDAHAIAGETDSYICVNLKNGKWGAGSLREATGGGATLFSYEGVAEYLSGSLTYDEFWPPTGTTTWDTVPDIPYDSPFFFGASAVLAVIGRLRFSGTDSRPTFLLPTTTGCAGSMTFGDIGDDLGFSTIRRILPRFLTAPALGTLTYSSRNVLSDALTVSAAAPTLTGGRFNIMHSARWHRAKFALNNPNNPELATPYVITDVLYDFEPDGEE